MKKILLTFSFIAFVATFSFGQWVDNGATINTGDIPVITATGIAAGIIENRTDGAAGSFISGTSSVNFRYDNQKAFRIQSQLRSSVLAGIGGNIVQVATFSGAAPANSLFIAPDGNVGLGTAAPLAKLSVDGDLRCTEAKVLSDISAPDYVFAPEYNLRSLEEVKTYIDENSHLPEIPSAAEFAENGIDVGQMSFDLLKKVEELTLYMIDMKKENEALKSRINTLEEVNKK